MMMTIANPSPWTRLMSLVQRIFSPFESEELADQEGDDIRHEPPAEAVPADEAAEATTKDSKDEDDDWGVFE